MRIMGHEVGDRLAAMEAHDSHDPSHLEPERSIAGLRTGVRALARCEQHVWWVEKKLRLLAWYGIGNTLQDNVLSGAHTQPLLNG
jgi:hypothetical protein